MNSTLLYGPPGTGKTRTLADAFGLLSYSRPPSAFVSFSRAAAKEALSRVVQRKDDYVGTIHARIFRDQGILRDQMVDLQKLRSFGRAAGYHFDGTANDTEGGAGVWDRCLAIQGRAVAREVAPQEEYLASDRPCSLDAFEAFCDDYAKWKKGGDFIDFNDLLLLHCKHPCRLPVSVLCVDEAQDLTPLQWGCIEMWLAVSDIKEVHVAGDDDQAIFEWAGAEPSGMAAFEARHSATRRVLSQSWRLPKSVFAVAKQVIAPVKNRVAKEFTPREEEGVVRRFSRFEPNDSIPKDTDVLVLCRDTVTQAASEEALASAGVPYMTNDKDKSNPFTGSLATAIRAFRKLEGGEPMSHSDISKMQRVSSPETKAELSECNFSGLLKRGYMASFNIPAAQWDIFQNLDVRGLPRVTVSTIHGAKGREADHVALHTGMTTKIESNMFLNPDAEARVWYVGVTRARCSLDIIDGAAGGYRI